MINKLLCKLFGHKFSLQLLYPKIPIEENFNCYRCGKKIDIFSPGSQYSVKNMKISLKKWRIR